MTPALAAWRLGCSVLLGAVLGIVYGALRPLGEKHRILADVLFLPAAFWIWIYICFAVCRGDVRTVYLLGMLAGLLFWEKTVGRWLRPVFTGIWDFAGKVWHFILLPWKKFLIFAKILFASAEKWVTIECTKLFKSQKKRGGVSHGRKKHSAEKCESGSSSRIQYP